MSTAVRTRIIQIGNSRGIRIPKPLLEQINFAENEEVDLILEANQIIVRPAYQARHGWGSAFKEMAARGDDEMLAGDISIATDWEEMEWEW